MLAVDPISSPGTAQPAPRPAEIEVLDLGMVDYQQAWDLQKQLATERAALQRPNTLLLLEHPPTYTFGSRGKAEHMLVPPAELLHQGIAVLHVDRGGDVTYHGPGQLVVYPIIQLRDYGLGIVQYLRELERVLIAVCASYGLAAERVRGYTGAWIGDAKVAAIGAKVDLLGITRHGCALNVTTDLAAFERIVPCGIRDKGVTSLSAALGQPVAMAEVKTHFVAAFRDVFTLCPADQGTAQPG